MNRKNIQTPKAPQAIGPYSQAVSINGYLFTAGQIPLDPATGEMVKGDITVQTTRVMENLKGILEASGTQFKHVIKATVYLHSMDDFAAMNAVYENYLGAVKPARSTVEVVRLPKGAAVEIDLVAVIP